ncbi:TorD/DmsD family molecular chaperone [Desulfitibacter alkalitolerans]|uniref:TorD/DmsD family molecular chaperone n=1 Tax=Desulfitibacter alkalitolerans TaxID=264641 RepID=UPI00047F9595|nr:molecular chaperone [Desulfitibacter alkalitolerans]
MEGIENNRKMNYVFLSNQFKHQLTAEVLAKIIENKIFQDYPFYFPSSKDEGLELINTWLDKGRENFNESLKELAKELAFDYNKLFVGPDKVLAPPWESVYTSEERVVFARPTMEVRDFYRRHNIEYQRLNQEPEDHFAVELEFMAHLIEKQEEALTKKEKDLSQYYILEQRKFMVEHLQQWAYLFLDQVYQKASTDYYRGLALFTRGFLEWDAQNLV